MDISQFTKNGRFLMLALDHRESFRKILNPQNPDSVSDEEIIKIKSEIIDNLCPQFSSLLLDVKYGLPAYIKKDRPFLLSIEKSGYKEVNGERITELEYKVEELKQLGAKGIKLLLYFNPYLPSAADQLSTALKVLQDSHSNNLPLFLEIVTYGGSLWPSDRRPKRSTNGLVTSSVRLFVEKNIIPDVFKLDHPGDSGSCDEITRLLGKTPWILLTGGENFDLFKKQLEEAVLHGASGFLAGRALWQEVGQYKDADERKMFLTSVVAKRFAEITSIVEKKAFLA